MKKTTDELNLSAYMDGELDTEAMLTVEQAIESDEMARDFILDAVKSGAHLRAGLDSVLEEDIPDRLLDPFISERPKRVRRKSPVLKNMIRIAAAVILLITGFGVSEIIYRTGGIPRQAFVEPLSGPYRQVVDAALENYLSGTSHEWQQGGPSPDTVRVTPLKTYRDKAGTYFREYRLEVERNEQTMFVKGLAYRAAKGSWKTKALYF
ncbi:MAG: hypothetical protein ACR2PH_10495 [Desulfobulbia bacterium]